MVYFVVLNFVSKSLREEQMPDFSLYRHPCNLYEPLINLPHNSDTIYTNSPWKDITVTYNMLYLRTNRYTKNAGAGKIKIHINNNYFRIADLLNTS
jgi:hypothetical protein